MYSQSHLVAQDLLHDERRHRLAQLAPELHRAEAERDDLRAEKEVDHVRVVHLHQRADHAQRRQPQVLERPRLGDGVQERVQKQRDVRVQEERAGVGMRRDALQERQRVTHAVRRVVGERRRREQRVDGDDLLQQRGDDSEGVPQDGRQVREHVAFLGQVQKRVLARLRILKRRDERLHGVHLALSSVVGAGRPSRLSTIPPRVWRRLTCASV